MAERHPRLILIAALVIALVALPLAGKREERLTAGGVVSSASQSSDVSDAIEGGAFPGAEVSPLAVVLQPRADARAGDLNTAIERVGEQLRDLDEVEVGSEGRRRAVASAGARPDAPVLLPLSYGGENSIDIAREVMEELDIENPDPGKAAGGRVDVHVIGQGALWAGFIQRANEDVGTSEARAFPILALVLLLAFGSLAAAVLPLTLGFFAVIVTLAAVYLLSFATEVSVFAASAASMIGLGVAVDYSLFILVRYREEVRAGATPEAARARAMATSGRAVAYSGLTVAISLSALFLISSPGVRSIAAGTITVVAVSVLAASTLLPVLIARLGRRAHEPGRLGRYFERRRGRRGREEGAFWARWTGVVMRHPLRSLLAAVALLLALAAPTLDLSVRNSATNQLPADHQVRQGIDIVTGQAGSGVLGPVLVMVGSGSGEKLEESTADRVRDQISRDPAVRAVDRPKPSRDGSRVLLSAVLDAQPESQAARDAVDRLRDELPAVAGEAEIDVGGTTAIILDFDRLITKDMWQLIVFVLAASFLVLLVLLRSLVLPIKATLMNVLSVLAAYGSLVIVFQYGWLEFVGIDKAETIYPITLPLVLAIAFGLSMDYHIFMLSRIQERYRAIGDNREAVAQALARSATPITSAAVIMIAVFLAFVSASSPSIQQLGFAAAVAIAIDATIVRLVIVPAAMELLGDWNWWLPRPLARVLGERPIVSELEAEPAGSPEDERSGEPAINR